MNAVQKFWIKLIVHPENQIGMAILALIAGLFSGLVIALFRLAIELPLVSFFPILSAEDYEGLEPLTRSILLITGGVLLVVMYRFIPLKHRSTGVVHVLQRMEQHQGYLPLKNTVLQWFSSVIAILSGHSVGREGPAIHLGAGTASSLGQYAGIAHHRLRILAAAGVASAISASFNTPLAGVIFAMEVVLLEYSIRSFIPIILASVAGAIVTAAVFGSETAFNVTYLAMESLWELPYIILLGCIAGCIAALYISSVKLFQRINHLPLWVCWGGLTLATLVVSLFKPEILGIGYDTVNKSLSGEILFSGLILLLFAKLFLSAWAAAVSFPAGLIGPTLFMGAALGALMGQISQWLLPEYPAQVGFYALIGMGAMMGAILRAPLAALVAIFELSGNHNIIWPAMLAIVTASLIVSELFKLPSVFSVQLSGNQAYQPPHPVTQMLRNTWIAEAMERKVIMVDNLLTASYARDILSSHPEWIIIKNEGFMIRPAELAEALASDIPQIDLLSIPADRQAIEGISLKANLQGALNIMQDKDLEWLSVYKDDDLTQLVGVVSHDSIHSYYQYKG